MSNEEVLQGYLAENIIMSEDITSIITQIDEKGIAVLFTFIDDETSILEASITDNYVETNHSMQDHIAIKPRIYRLRGCVGEVVYQNSSKWIEALSNKINSNPILKKTMQGMKAISSISGIVNSATQTAINIVNQLEASYNRYRQLIENFIPGHSKRLSGKMQQSVVADLNRILELRIPVNLKGTKFETTLDAGNNYKRKYYLQSVSAHQGSNDFISDIEVTIKEFRIASTQVVALDKNKYGDFSPSAVQKQQEVNQGKAKGEEVPKPAVQKAKEVMTELKENHPVVYNTTKKVYNAVTIGSKGILNNSIAGNSALGKLGAGIFNGIGRAMAGYLGGKQ